MVSEYILKRQFNPMPISNCHVHIYRPRPLWESLQLYRNMREYLNVNRMILLALEEDTVLEDRTSNMQALYMKEQLENTYAFANFSYQSMDEVTPEAVLSQAKLYMEMGFDGIKMLEGKYDFHEKLGYKLDGPLYTPFFAYAQEKEIPILIHIADPVSSLADKSGAKEKLHEEMENVLEKFPSLHILLAHFYFMSHDMEHFEEIFTKYPNVRTDLTLGGDFLIRFSENIDKWRDFFIRHSNRILFGTDCYNLDFTPEDDYEITNRYTPVRDFLEKEDPYVAECYTRFMGEPMLLWPAHLPEEALKNIYQNNLMDFAGKAPKMVNHKLALEHTESLLEAYRLGKLHTRAFDKLPDYFAADEVANMSRGDTLAVENLEVIRNHFIK